MAFAITHFGYKAFIWNRFRLRVKKSVKELRAQHEKEPGLMGRQTKRKQ